ncbi:Sporulation related domain-containing protein [Loktanella fryxellensis]|uniref:Sporulation related domain-containing protein n=1 Tax=Loktanella fryxellensis TaxID=245187 RepID=A0A1H8GDK8_9RHOB|nr:SPOR domain-containing protein [Loktanella fryxellensis]SEN41860.1 Sporulation related domain-containing protein [Loktanella fryxellensis]
MVDGLQITIRDTGTDSGPARGHGRGLRRWGALAALLTSVAVAGCDKLPARDAAAGAADAVTADGMALADSDIEAPEIFSKSEAGLWDGRPSLGGVWVAHPEVTDPERVIIRNTANGNFVIGALFRRELENPGPALQVSSDAAEALGLLAGAPETLEVVALRRAEAPAPTATAITDFEAPEVIAAVPLDDAAPTTGGAAASPVTETALVDDTATAAPAAPAPAATVATGSAIARPFLQIGIFSVEANANETAERLRSNGLSASVLAGNSQGKPFWRVVVGPAPTESDRDAVLATVKGLGFPDAYAVTN